MSYYKYHKKSSKKMRIKLLFKGHLHTLSLEETSVQALRNLVSQHFEIQDFELFHNGQSLKQVRDKMQIVCVNRDKPKITFKDSLKEFKPQAFRYLQQRKINDHQLQTLYLVNGLVKLPDQDFHLLCDPTAEIQELQEIGDDQLRLNNWLWRKLRDKPYALGNIGHSVVKLIRSLTQGAKSI